MDAWQKPIPNGDGTVRWIADDDKARRQFRDATVIDGVVRWQSNGAVPPADCCAQWARLGLAFDLAKTTAARDTELAAFLAEYRRTATAPSAEQRAEMRAAFGPGTEVVNVITGRRTRL
jgi:hypothetical protein